MDTTNTTNATSPVRGVMTYFMGAIAVLTCPCHLPILILLLSGTAAGMILQENLGMAALLLLALFLLSAFATWRLLDQSMIAHKSITDQSAKLQSVPVRRRSEKPTIEA